MIWEVCYAGYVDDVVSETLSMDATSTRKCICLLLGVFRVNADLEVVVVASYVC